MTLTTITKVKALNAVMAGAVRSDDDPASQREHEAGGKPRRETARKLPTLRKHTGGVGGRFSHSPKSLHDAIVASFTLSLRSHTRPKSVKLEMPPVATSTATTFKYVGGPTTDANRSKSLTYNGPLLISPDHVIAKLIPEALDVTSNAPLVTVQQRDIEYLLTGSILFDSQLYDLGMHGAIRVTRLAAIIQDLMDSGFDTTPITGGKATAFPLAEARIAAAIKILPTDKRTVTKDQMLFDGDPSDPETGTWFDHITPGMFLAGDGAPEVVAQMKALLSCVYNKDDINGGRASSTFTHTLQAIVSSVGRDVSGLNGAAQAAAVVSWAKKTRPPPELAPYVSDASLEIERRAAPTAAERFEPLFAVRWRDACTQLATLWPQEVPNVIVATGALARPAGKISI